MSFSAAGGRLRTTCDYCQRKWTTEDAYDATGVFDERIDQMRKTGWIFYQTAGKHLHWCPKCADKLAVATVSE